MGIGIQNLENVLALYLPAIAGKVASTPAPTTTTATITGPTLVTGTVAGATALIGSALTTITANTGNALTFTALAAAPAGGAAVTIYIVGGANSGVAQNVSITDATIQVPTDLQGIDQPSGDSTTATLGSAAVYTGTAFSTANARGIIGSIFSDQSGTLQVQQSPDGTNWDIVDTIYYPGGSEGLQFSVPVEAPGKSQARLVYTNGPTAQTVNRLFAWTTPQPVERTVSVPTQVAATTSITTGGTSQTLFAARPGRRFLLAQNPSTATGQGITTAESLWIGIGVAATTAPPSIELVTGALVIFDVAVDPQAINVIAATTSHAFTARQA